MKISGPLPIVEGIALCTAARHAFDFEAPRATLADLFDGSGSFASKQLTFPTGR